MAVTHDDVRHIAELSRLTVPEARLEALAAELNGILIHVDTLSEADTSEIEKAAQVASDGTPLRSDSSGPIPLLTPLRDFAPEVRDGLILVPRLASHETAGDGA